MHESAPPNSTTRDTLLDAAEQLFGERGYAAVGTREIAEQANANIASIKYHFGSKSELYLATVRRAMGKSDAGNVWNFLKPASSVPVDAAAVPRDMHHTVTESIGRRGAGGPRIDVERCGLLDGDAVLLCTNGLTDVMGAAAIADVLRQKRTPDQLCHRLVDLAVDAGGSDDITALLAQYRIQT